MAMPDDILSESSRKLLEARAQRLREKPEEEETDLVWLAEFPLGGQAYALPLASLISCQSLRLVTPVPLSDPRLAGVIRFQRAILPVFSLSALTRASGWRRDPSVILILQLEGDRRIAVDCEEIPRALGIGQKEIMEAVGSESHDSALEVPRPGGGTLRILDLPRFFPHLRQGGGHGR